MLKPRELKQRLKVYRDKVGELDYKGAAQQADRVKAEMRETDNDKLINQAAKMGDMAKAMMRMHDQVISRVEKAHKLVKDSVAIVRRLEREAGGQFEDAQGSELFTRRPLVQSLRKLEGELSALTKGGSDLYAYTGMAGSFRSQIMHVAKQVEGEAASQLQRQMGKIETALKAISTAAEDTAANHTKTWDSAGVLQRFYKAWHARQGESMGRARKIQRIKRAGQRRAAEQKLITYSVWDRKTPRHKWQIVTRTENRARAYAMAAAQLKRVKTHGWANGQVGILERPTETGGSLPSSLPASTKMKKLLT